MHAPGCGARTHGRAPDGCAHLARRHPAGVYCTKTVRALVRHGLVVCGLRGHATLCVRAAPANSLHANMAYARPKRPLQLLQRAPDKARRTNMTVATVADDQPRALAQPLRPVREPAGARARRMDCACRQQRTSRRGGGGPAQRPTAATCNLLLIISSGGKGMHAHLNMAVAMHPTSLLEPPLPKAPAAAALPRLRPPLATPGPLSPPSPPPSPSAPLSPLLPPLMPWQERVAMRAAAARMPAGSSTAPCIPPPAGEGPGSDRHRGQAGLGPGWPAAAPPSC